MQLPWPIFCWHGCADLPHRFFFLLGLSLLAQNPKLSYTLIRRDNRRMGQVFIWPVLTANEFPAGTNSPCKRSVVGLGPIKGFHESRRQRASASWLIMGEEPRQDVAKLFLFIGSIGGA
jgi:hypothetical protein